GRGRAARPPRGGARGSAGGGDPGPPRLPPPVPAGDDEEAPWLSIPGTPRDAPRLEDAPGRLAGDGPIRVPPRVPLAGDRDERVHLAGGTHRRRRTGVIGCKQQSAGACPTQRAP